MSIIVSNKTTISQNSLNQSIGWLYSDGLPDLEAPRTNAVVRNVRKNK